MFDDLKVLEKVVDVLTKDTPEALRESPEIPEIPGDNPKQPEHAPEATAKTPETPEIPGGSPQAC